MFQKVVADSFKLFDCILSIHLREHVIMSRLDGDVNEAKYARMVQEACYCLQVVQHVRRICHPQPHHYLGMVLELFAEVY
jgi:hypothetical protein